MFFQFLFLVIFQLGISNAQPFATVSGEKIRLWNYFDTNLNYNKYFTSTSHILKLEVFRKTILIGINSENEIFFWDFKNNISYPSIKDNQTALSISAFDHDHFVTTYSQNKIKKWNFNKLTHKVYDNPCNYSTDSYNVEIIRFMLNRTQIVLLCTSKKKGNDRIDNKIQLYDGNLIVSKKSLHLNVRLFEIVNDNQIALSFLNGSILIYNEDLIFFSDVNKLNNNSKEAKYLRHSKKGFFIYATFDENFLLYDNIELYKQEGVTTWNKMVIGINKPLINFELVQDDLIFGFSEKNFLYWNISSNQMVVNSDRTNFDLCNNIIGSIPLSTLSELCKIFDNNANIQSFVLDLNKTTCITSYLYFSELDNTIDDEISTKTSSDLITYIHQVTEAETITLTNTTSPITTTNTEPINQISSNSLEAAYLHDETKFSYTSPSIVSDYFLNQISMKDYLEIMKFNIDINDCLSNCSNNGNCFTLDRTFKCKCGINYTGSKCDIDLRPCSSSPCINQALCHNSPDMKYFKCECLKNIDKKSLYYGKYCENKVDLCQNETCSANGYCYVSEDEPKCKCFYGYYGNNCQNKQSYFQVYNITKKTVVSIAIIILIMSYVLCILNDLADYFCNLSINIKRNYRELIKKKKSKIKKSIKN